MSFYDKNPQKEWECDICGTVVKGYYLDKHGGRCPNCGYDEFTEVDRNQSIWDLEG